MLQNALKPVLNGFKLMASEAKWVVIKCLRSLEIRQLRKRLGEELQTLGKAFADAQSRAELFDPTTSDNDLILKQISFLQQEIDHLEKELAATRAEYVHNRSGDSEA